MPSWPLASTITVVPITPVAAIPAMNVCVCAVPIRPDRARFLELAQNRDQAEGLLLEQHVTIIRQ